MRENDQVTEVLLHSEGNIRIYSDKPRNFTMKDNYAVFYLDRFLDIAQDSNLTLTSIRVLMGLWANSDFENQVSITQKDLAKQLEIKQPNIAKAINELIKGNYLIIHQKIHKQNIYFLNPYIFIKSDGRNRKMLERIWDERNNSPKTLENTKKLA